MSAPRKAYTSDVTDLEWEFVLPYLALMKLDAPQRSHDPREVFNGLRYVVRSGCQWRDLPHDLPPWHTVYQQTKRWFESGAFEMIVHDLRSVLRLAEGKNAHPSAAIFDGQVLRSTPESGDRAAFNGHKHKKGSKVHMAVDTLGHLLALTVTPANQDERTQIQALCREVQQVTGNNIALVYGDQGYNGKQAKQTAAEEGIELQVVTLPQTKTPADSENHPHPAKRGFVLLPRRWVVERSFAWKSRFRRLVRDYERLDTTLKAMHFLAFAGLMLAKVCLLAKSA